MSWLEGEQVRDPAMCSSLSLFMYEMMFTVTEDFISHTKMLATSSVLNLETGGPRHQSMSVEISYLVYE